MSEPISQVIHEMSTNNITLRDRCKAELEADQAEFDDEQSGVHLVIKWSASRHDIMKFWRGYFEPDRILTDEEYQHIETLSHYELTATDGFDCGHYNDYPVGGSDMHYRTFPYVRAILFKIIEYIQRHNSQSTSNDVN
jgi:hypothetical protein